MLRTDRALRFLSSRAVTISRWRLCRRHLHTQQSARNKPGFLATTMYASQIPAALSQFYPVRLDSCDIHACWGNFFHPIVIAHEEDHDGLRQDHLPSPAEQCRGGRSSDSLRAGSNRWHRTSRLPSRRSVPGKRSIWIYIPAPVYRFRVAFSLSCFFRPRLAGPRARFCRSSPALLLRCSLSQLLLRPSTL